MTSASAKGIKTLIYPVSVLATAKPLYAAVLGGPPQIDEPSYVGFEAEGQHIGLVPGGGARGVTSPVAYWHAANIEARLAEMVAAGATVKEPVHDVGDGRLVATATDPDGNILGLLLDRSRAEPRSGAQRRRDAEHRLSHDKDVWVASASDDGAPYLVPLSFGWDGEALLVATPTTSPTGRNLAATRVVRLGLGHTRDVYMIDGEVEVVEVDKLPKEHGDQFAEYVGFDPRAFATPYRGFRITPRRIQAWREENELPGRELMRDSQWLVD